MNKSVKITLITLSILLILVVGLFIYGYNLIKQSLPPERGTFSFDSIADSVEITFDKMGIPQIWAEGNPDAYFAFGYIHARDRLFQMDMTRRIAQGRLAEMLGETVLEIDKNQRAVGHNRLVKKWLPRISEANLKKLQSYSAGVNTYVQNLESLPFEYHVLTFDFEKWTVYDCLTILSFQTWFSNFLMSPDTFMMEAFKKLDPKKAAAFKSTYPDWAPKTVPQNENNSLAELDFKKAVAQKLFQFQTLPFLMSHSSNSWVVAPEKNVSGAAVLCSDPHLDISHLPQFWYHLGMHVRLTGEEILGISTPGLPFITMGHNGSIAWAFTVGGIDINEYYIEKINDDTTQYLTADGWQNFEIYKESINVSGQDKAIERTIRISKHGPVIMPDDTLSIPLVTDSAKTVICLRWAGYDSDLNAALTAGFSLPIIKNFEQFRHTVTRFGALDVNWTYADKNGNIGYQLGTPLPIRNWENTNLPLPGWTGKFEWQGYQPIDKTPHSLNPKQGWLATCNNKQDEANLDYELEGYFAPDRILSITKFLQEKDVFSHDDYKSFQMNRHDLYLLRWKEILLSYLNMHNYKNPAQIIIGWDGNADKNSLAAALINIFIQNLKIAIFSDELGDNLHHINGGHLEAVLQEDSLNWFDNVNTTDVIEDKNTIIVIALKKTIQQWDSQSWGSVHSLTMAHPLSVVPVLSGLLGLTQGPMEWGGTSGTLNASFFFPVEEEVRFKSIVGPSWRFIIDFSDVDGATMVLPSGNSGHPLSPHFMDFFELWKSGQQWNVPFSYKNVRKKAVSSLYLVNHIN